MARGKLIPKENLFYVIERLGDKATWQNIYDNTIGENGKRYASNDIGYSLEYYLENNMLKEKQMNKKTRVFSLGESVNDTYDDFLKNVFPTNSEYYAPFSFCSILNTNFTLWLFEFEVML